MSFYSDFYAKNYKKYLIAPVILLVILLYFVFFVGPTKGVDLSGGTLLSVYTSGDYNPTEISTVLSNKFNLEGLYVTVSEGASENRIDIQYTGTPILVELKSKIDAIKSNTNQKTAAADAKVMLESYAVDVTGIKEQDYKIWMSNLDVLYGAQKNKNVQIILGVLNTDFGVNTEKATIKEVAPVLGASFYSKAVGVVIAAILLTIIVILIFFREVIPSAAIVACGVMDVLGGITGMILFDIPLSMITIPALLMLLGYSIDTDIMLTTKLLKRSDGTPSERAGDSFRTGTYMTTTTLAALVAMLVVSKLYNIGAFFDISVVLLSGLIVDLVGTWLMNAPVLLWFVEWKNKAKQRD